VTVFVGMIAMIVFVQTRAYVAARVDALCVRFRLRSTDLLVARAGVLQSATPKCTVSTKWRATVTGCQ